MQVVTRPFSLWLATTSFAGHVEPGDTWDTPEAWPSARTMAAARQCYSMYHAGDMVGAERAIVTAQQPFV